MNPNRKIHQAALAGLLHNVGKFAQRAGEQVSAEWSAGKTRQDFKYQHALHTWHFINKHVPNDFGVGVLAAYHHRPQNTAQRCIRLADQLSAGERDSGQDRDDSDRSTHPRQLHPIFAQVVADDLHHPTYDEKKQMPDPDQFYFPLKPLALQEEVIFPQDRPLADAEAWAAYKAMWDAFCREAEALKDLPLEAYLEAMQALMQRYTWCIPSAYFKTVPDVSLYDHSRMTAALAVCLSEFEDEQIAALHNDWRKRGGPSWDAPVALLVGGDISGVQDFIYTISSKGAAKALRGRSFYLQLLTEAVLRFVLRELNLPYTNVIYSGGGHFFLLAPLGAAGELQDVRAAVSQKLLAHHGTALYLALGWAEVPLQGFEIGRFTEYWDAMHKNLQEAKARRYAELGGEMHALVFQLRKDGGGDKHCAVCGADDVRLFKWKEESESETQMICSQCRSYVKDLGAKLPKTRYLRWRSIEPADTPRGTFADALKAFGVDVEPIEVRDEKTPSVEMAAGDVLWALDDPEDGNWPAGSMASARWLRYTVHQIPMDGEQPVTFDVLQKQGESGFERLGVLRMDVDNLGDVFKDGLKDKATLSRLSALSSQMSLFFEGWVKRIIARDNRKDLIYAVYAGGDDVFLIGPWEVMPDVALDIANEFSAYTGHPGLHLSGGMAFIHGKYPVYQAAEDAGREESRAKDVPGKKAFAFLNTAWKWEKFEKIKTHQETLYKLVKGTDEAGGSPKSLLMLLRSLAKMESEAAASGERPVWGRWMWMGAYHLTRVIERNKKKNVDLAKRLESMRKHFEENNYRDLPQWGVAARWAQLRLRKGK